MKQLWEKLDPKLKRIVWVGSIVSFIITVMYIVMPESSSLSSRKQEKVIEHMFTNKDTKSLTLQSMSANIDSLKTTNAKVLRQLDTVTADVKELQRQNGPTRLMQREVADLKAQIDTSQRERSTIIQRIDEIQDSSIDMTQDIVDQVARKVQDTVKVSSGTANGMIPIIPSMTVVPDGAEPSVASRSPLVDVTENISHPEKEEVQIYDSAEEFFKRSDSSKRSVSTSGTTSSSKSNSGKSGGSRKIAIRSISADDPSATIAQNAKRIKKERKTTSPKDDESFDIKIPAGSILEAVIIAGLDAPTNQSAKSSPYPSLMRIKKEAVLPSRYTADVRECFLLASGYGDMGSERAYMRGETISCITDEGGVIESRFDSFAVGEDGKTGVRGRLVTKNGALIANAMLAGFGEGLSSAFDVSVVPTISNESSSAVDFQRIMSEEAVQSGALGGAKSAMSRIADYYLDMAENITPVIEIDAGRVVSFITSKGITLKTK